MKAAVLGASGIIGQQFIRLLNKHPLFEITEIYASERSAGKKLSKMWRLPGHEVPEKFADMDIQEFQNGVKGADVVFSALPSSVAGKVETTLREQGMYVFSNASAHRMDSNVPILIPEINGFHMEVVENQEGDGFIVTNSNCSISGVSMYLHELRKIIPFTEVHVSTYQALSGAGQKGLTNPDFRNNVTPFIKGEEEKMEAEGKKILSYSPSFADPGISIYANCARVDVTDGHLASVNVVLTEKVDAGEIIKELSNLKSPLNGGYHIAPNPHLVVMQEEDRPQPMKDAFLGNGKASGMTVPVGRIRGQGHVLKAFVLAHNTIRGGAGGSVLNAEYAFQNNYMR